MKKLFILSITLFFCSCKDETQELINDLSGTWKVDEIVYSKTGQTAPDSVVKYPNSIFQLDQCELTGSIRSCSGFYDLTGTQNIKIVYNASPGENTTFIAIMDEEIPKISLLGSYRISQSGNSMTLKGPRASSPTYQGNTIELRLKK